MQPQLYSKYQKEKLKKGFDESVSRSMFDFCPEIATKCFSSDPGTERCKVRSGQAVNVELSEIQVVFLTNNSNFD